MTQIEGASPASVRDETSGGTGPLLVCDGEMVLDACPQAVACGVRPGMPTYRAQVLCPAARTVPARPERYQEVWEGLLDLIARHTPAVEPEGLGTAYLEAGGMARLYGDDDAWCQALLAEARSLSFLACVGVAGGKFAARVAAQSTDPEAGYQIVLTDDRDYLAPLSLDGLPLPVEARRRLRTLGIHTMGRFARLSSVAVIEQLGPECTEPHRWARGQDDRPLRGRQRKAVDATQDFGSPVAERGQLVEAGVRLGSALLSELTREGLTVWRLSVRLQLTEGATWERTMALREPLGPERLRVVLAEMLAALDGESAGATELHLRLGALGPAVGRQLELFASVDGRVQMEEILARLMRRYPTQSVLRVQVRNPGALLVADRYRLVEYAS